MGAVSRTEHRIETQARHRAVRSHHATHARLVIAERVGIGAVSLDVHPAGKRAARLRTDTRVVHATAEPKRSNALPGRAIDDGKRVAPKQPANVERGKLRRR